MNAAPAIRAVELTRRFGDLTAVEGLNLEIGRGEIFGLVGPDGAGKTTTLRMLCGLMDPTSGQARVEGAIGYMAQRFGLYGDLTVDENMEFYAGLFGVPRAERERLAPSLLEMTRMAPFRERRAAKLSGGMKQKLALMCTLLHRPEVLLLDEPTNGVDPVSRRDFWAILYQLVRDGITVVVTTAYLDEAERCHRVGLMNRGRLIRCDTPRALRRGMEEECWEIRGEDLRALRGRLARVEGVVSVEPAGPVLHAFVRPGVKLEGVEARRIVPSLEDVFIGVVRGGRE